MSHFGDRLAPWAVLVAYWWLVIIHLLLCIRGFGRVHIFVGSFKARRGGRRSTHDLGVLLASFELARQLYVKEAKCLHLAAAITVFLRGFGLPVNMVFGISPHPFFGHTWVELNGNVGTGTRSRDQFIVIDAI